MNSNQVKYFLEAAESGSMLKTAEKNYMTQPAVSMAIAKLEEELQAKLLNRSKQGVSLTPAGKLAQKKFLQMRQQLEDLKTELAPFGTETNTLLTSQSTGRLELCTTVEISNGILNDLLEVCGKKYPLYTFLVKEYDFWGVFSAVRQKQAELGIFYIIDELLYEKGFQDKLKETGIGMKKLGADRLAVGVSRQSSWAGKKSLSIKTVAQQKVAAYNSSTTSCWQELFLKRYHDKASVMQTNSLAYCSELLVKRDYMVFLLNSRQFLPALEDQAEYVVIPIKENVAVTIGVFYREDEPLSMMAQEVLAMVQKAWPVRAKGWGEKNFASFA